MADPSTKIILVLGASFAGLGVVHQLMKNTIPTLKNHKVVVVAPSSTHYWNVASVRAIVPGQIAEDKIYGDLMPGFKSYSAATFQFIQGLATNIDPASKTVTLSTAGAKVEQAYDVLVIATGSRYEQGAPWKLSPDGIEATKATLRAVQDKVKNASSILLGGAGPTGVEAACELGYEFGKTKEISIATSGDKVLHLAMPDHVSDYAEKEMAKLNVHILRNSKVISTTTTASGQTEVTFENGQKKVVDLYLPTSGVIRNTEFVPESLRNAGGDVKVDEYLRSSVDASIWALGDVVDVQPAGLVNTQSQSKSVASNLNLVLNGKEPVVYKKNMKLIGGVTLGRDKGTGRFGNMKIPSFPIWFLKGRTMFTERMAPLIAGNV